MDEMVIESTPELPPELEPIIISKPKSTPEPTPTPTPSPTPTPAPPESNTPEPDLPTPTPTQTRFYEYSNGDGTTTIYDRENHYKIIHSEKKGYIAYDDLGREVYHIYPDGMASFTLDDGRHIVGENISYQDVKEYCNVIDKNGNEYVIHNRMIEFKRINYEDGSFKKYRYNIDGSYNEEDSAGNTVYYDSNGKEYKHIYPNGDITFKTEANQNFVICKDGTYIFYGNNVEYGKYEIDEDGNIICHGDNGSTTKRTSLGKLLEYETVDGTVYKNDYSKMSLTKTKDGTSSYSMINHIEYEEEAYDDILKTFVNVSDSYESSIKNNTDTINNTLGEFPDPYDKADTIIEAGSNIITSIKFVGSLKEMTNYSLLAYQTCDEDIRMGLESLIDSLFEDNESNLSRNFKANISSNIEDRDNDSILEYKKDTNFNLLYLNAVPAYKYVDQDGNTWYMNKRDLLVGTEGENFKLKYGGKEFTMNYDKNGIMIIKDSDGNPVDIFADYNIDSYQFGSDQCVFDESNGVELLNDPEIQAILEQYYPGATDEEKLAYLNAVANTGCGNAGMTNLVFKKFEGKEEEFYSTFGFPMYNIKFERDSLSIDYNYEPLFLDLFANGHKKNNIEGSTKSACGTNIFGRNEMEDYLK